MRTKAHFFKDCNLNTILEPASKDAATTSCTKIVATIGPSCQTVDKLVQMLNVSLQRFFVRCIK